MDGHLLLVSKQSLLTILIFAVIRSLGAELNINVGPFFYIRHPHANACSQLFSYSLHHQQVPGGTNLFSARR